MLVVVFPRFELSSNAFSISFSCPGLFRRGMGGSLSRTPVLRFWRFVAGRSAVERPVRRRDARRRDCRTSHWRFFASQKRTAEETEEDVRIGKDMKWNGKRNRTSKNDYKTDHDDDGCKTSFRQREAALLRTCCSRITGVYRVVLAAIVSRVRRVSSSVRVLGRRRVLRDDLVYKRQSRQEPVGSGSPRHDAAHSGCIVCILSERVNWGPVVRVHTTIACLCECCQAGKASSHLTSASGHPYICALSHHVYPAGARRAVSHAASVMARGRCR